MATEKVAPTAGLQGKDFSDATTSQDTTPGASAHDEEVATSKDGSHSDHVFSDPKVAEYWRGVYEKARYECRHRFDPSATWTADEEKKLRRRVDFRILAWCWLMFVSLGLNRRNINRGWSHHD